MWFCRVFGGWVGGWVGFSVRYAFIYRQILPYVRYILLYRCAFTHKIYVHTFTRCSFWSVRMTVQSEETERRGRFPNLSDSSLRV